MSKSASVYPSFVKSFYLGGQQQVLDWIYGYIF